MDFEACSCDECKAMCERRPCWPTPDDAQRLIDAGYANRLMLDWWFDKAQDKTVYVLTPAIVGREAGQAPAIPSGRCTFLNEQGLCRLHDLGLKPTEGRQALCKERTPAGLHEQIGQTWEGSAGKTVIDAWEAGQRGRNQPHRQKRKKTE
jgi:hypothetical protein